MLGNEQYREYGGVPLKPKAGKACSGCGICAKLCPGRARSLNRVMLFVAGQKFKKVCTERKTNEFYLGSYRYSKTYSQIADKKPGSMPGVVVDMACAMLLTFTQQYIRGTDTR